ncbi:hypothetical protein [Prochlorococcus marinus]|uniref:hypothetical protein n=1 Tax=Prochlorococcus marinus TaxID=1219 RepID=UPI0022B31A6F|nr:hypothetical protein [Prochlorococcus marinus]
MLRKNFFLKFFQNKKNNSHEIIQYHSNEKFSLQDQINIQITEINQKISDNSTSLVEAQVVKLRSNFSQSNNFIDKLGKNIYKKKIDESINWHQTQLKELYLRRRELEINLEKIKGTFWLNQIKRFLRIIFIGFLIFVSLFIVVSGFMFIIYLTPFIILIFLGYLIFTKKY